MPKRSSISFNSIFGLVANSLVDNSTGQRPTASSAADFNNTVTLEKIELTADPEGNIPVPIESMTSDTGLVFRIVNGAAVPLVGTRTEFDIKPDCFPNVINMRSNGRIPAAILSSPDFNAPAAVDVDTLAFGVTGTERSLVFCNVKGEDVNGDGRPDLVCHFQTQRTGLQANTKALIYTAKTRSGDPIHGTDSVQVIR